MSDPIIESDRFRQVLGHFPTGVTVVTAAPPDAAPTGMAIGSFTSVSLDPPLVGFLPGRTSASWEAMRPAGSFCVNICAADQLELVGVFASKLEDKFAGIAWEAAPSGSPILPGCVGWIDCRTEAVHEAGDHDFVVGRVLDLHVGDEPGDPMVFFRGQYGTFGG